MFGFFKKKPAQPAFEVVARDFAKLIVVHIKARFDEAGIPTGPGGPEDPAVIDDLSRGDNYLIGYITGWCEIIEQMAPAIDSRDKYNFFYTMTLMALFGPMPWGSENELVAALTTPEFQSGVKDGREVATAFLTDKDAANYLVRHLIARTSSQ